MHYPMAVAIVDSLNDLVGKALDKIRRQFLLNFSEIFLKVILNIFEDQIETIVCVDHLFESKGLEGYAYSTTLGCLSPFRSEISRIAVEGTPSTSFSSLIFFSATV